MQTGIIFCNEYCAPIYERYNSVVIGKIKGAEMPWGIR